MKRLVRNSRSITVKRLQSTMSGCQSTEWKKKIPSILLSRLELPGWGFDKLFHGHTQNVVMVLFWWNTLPNTEKNIRWTEWTDITWSNLFFVCFFFCRDTKTSIQVHYNGNRTLSRLLTCSYIFFSSGVKTKYISICIICSSVIL